MALKFASRKHSVHGFIIFYVLLGFMWLIAFYFWPWPGGFFGIPANFLLLSGVSFVAHIIFWFKEI